jgi:hypothetical protein
MWEKLFLDKRSMIEVRNIVENCDETQFIKFETDNETSIALNNIDDSAINFQNTLQK